MLRASKGTLVAALAALGLLNINTGSAISQDAAPGEQPPNLTPEPPASTLSPRFSSTDVGFAIVRGNGNLVRGAGVRRARRLAQGRYEVIFNRNVRQCAYTATIGLPDVNNPNLGFISVAPRSGDSSGVFVRTANTRGNLENQSFHLTVTCR